MRNATSAMTTVLGAYMGSFAFGNFVTSLVGNRRRDPFHIPASLRTVVGPASPRHREIFWTDVAGF